LRHSNNSSLLYHFFKMFEDLCVIFFQKTRDAANLKCFFTALKRINLLSMIESCDI
jgi:hypothetical protein